MDFPQMSSNDKPIGSRRFSVPISRRRVALILLVVGLLVSSILDRSAAAQALQTNDITLDVYLRGDSERCEAARKYLEQLGQQRAGLKIQYYDVLEDQQALKRVWKLNKQFNVEKAGLPCFLALNQLCVGFDDEQHSAARIDKLFTVEAFVRPGCSRCANAKAFLNGLQQRWPAIRIEYRDVVNDPSAIARMNELEEQYHTRATGLPAIHLCGKLLFGYRGDHISGRDIEQLLRKYQSDIEDDGKSSRRSPSDRSRSALPAGSRWETLCGQPGGTRREFAQTGCLAMLPNHLAVRLAALWLQSNGADELPPPPADDLPPPPESASTSDPLPPPADDLPPVDSDPSSPPDSAVPQTIELPLFNTINVDELGLPLFTFCVGLVDGFNPCAMWVLVFLLSVLVNLKDRWKIVAVAGSFVVVSGLAYFAFMAAWFSIFKLIQLQRSVEIALGTLAVLIGLVNVKDFFWFKKGISLSIPESVKPSIYQRVRKIVTSQYLSAAIAGAVVLAVMVNLVELLCTAGLPALYTKILHSQNLPDWQNYLYLGLYNIAYMLDDSIVLCVVVMTLSHRKLQEREGRWLKFVSGVAILALGLAMLFQPDLLKFGH